MVLNIPGIFGDSRGLPIEEKAVLARENGVMTIIKPGTQTLYLSIRGTEFTGSLPDVDDINLTEDTGDFVMTGQGIKALVGVKLPHGAVVTGCIVYSNVSTENWTLVKSAIDSNTDTTEMASAALNTADTSITGATIDNSSYGYYIYTQLMDATDRIYGARITYTLADPDITAAVVINTTAYAAEQNLKGFKGTYVLNNQSGAQQTINWNIQNITKSTTLESGTGLVIANGNYSTLSHPWSTEQVSSGDTIRFTITSGGIGTQGSGNTFGYASFVVESIEETDVIT